MDGKILDISRPGGWTHGWICFDFDVMLLGQGALAALEMQPGLLVWKTISRFNIEIGCWKAGWLLLIMKGKVPKLDSKVPCCFP